MNNANFRIKELLVLGYRIFLAFFFYFIARTLFFAYNSDLLNVSSVSEFFKLAYHGLTFDRTAIFYVNALFILLSILPLWINTRKSFQKVLFYIYFVFNLLAYATNFIDFIYYKFIFSRTTMAVTATLEHESNKGVLFSKFLIHYWHVFALFLITAALWIFLYKMVKITPVKTKYNKPVYFGTSVVIFLVVGVGMLAGIRGDLQKSTRPLNMIDANRYVQKPEHADLILNTPFSLIRTFGKTSFNKVEFLSQEELKKNLSSKKFYTNHEPSKPNIVLFITESFSREYIQSFNEDMNIPNYVGYAPFIDSLAQHSLYFTNAFANGSKSIHGVSSVIAGIPSFKDAFTSSPYPKQKIESLVSTLKSEGYDTSFFHGAANGSMGFLGFSNILGYDHYYGRTEFNNDEEFDGVWGIWDEPFFQFVKQTLDKKQQPFFSTIFTVSSHEPYSVPEKYKGKFPKGTQPIHQTIGYTDYSFKKFFEAASKEPWFKNTIFIITADHTNQIEYKEYTKIVNRSAVPILIYTPDGRLQGKRTDLAQQIDIYPTVLDLIGYNKPFRSWGRSLVGDNQVEPFTINYIANQYIFQRGKYICTFDGQKVTGFYDIKDKALANNLIANKNAEMESLEKACKAFLQDYFERIIDRKLDK
ncbi:LTA synthase family protein [Flavobacterium sp. NKUCC04_CG]|uniref:LTA synthase family protein n=1 Tax=Flavobacterium sp. NKUCC04_CG TaxID=2842121 RepID=UPI001C5AE74B|nr:alkaline phosphatase family protein [Flavobacterium sp. NKUCC04_CG]MBW3517922.1 sulfatase-like hydrolase/transferase [Flavobacterium sp. NKUCC04_CG]